MSKTLWNTCLVVALLVVLTTVSSVRASQSTTLGDVSSQTVVPSVSSQDDSGSELSCGAQCHCTSEETTHGQEEWRIICNNTQNQHAILTDSVFNHVFPGGSKESSVDHVYVLIKNTTSLRVTTSFIAKWRKFPSCKFDIWKGGRVELPEVKSSILSRDLTQTHVFAGIGIHTCILEKFPVGLFEGKLKAGLRFTASTIGYFSSEVFRGTTLMYLNINHTNIGVYEGSLERTWLTNDRIGANKNNDFSDIYIGNSKLGVIKKGALSFKSKFERRMTIENVTVGYMQSGSVQMTGKMGLRMENSRVADLSYGSIEITSPATGIIQNNIFIAHPRALTNTNCSVYTKIENNQIIAISSDNINNKEWQSKDMNDSLDNSLDNAKAKNVNSSQSRIKSSTLLDQSAQFLHPSCITPKPKQQSLKDGKDSIRYALHISIVLIFLAVIVIIVLTILLIRAKDNKRTVVSSVRLGDLSEPIYDVPIIINQRGPPPPPSPLPTHLAVAIPDFCAGAPQSAVINENDQNHHKHLKIVSQDSRENLYVKMDHERPESLEATNLLYMKMSK